MSGVIVIGRVRKIVYHENAGEIFHTSAFITVDEWLRDDYTLKNRYEEVILRSY